MKTWKTCLSLVLVLSLLLAAGCTPSKPNPTDAGKTNGTSAPSKNTDPKPSDSTNAPTGQKQKVPIGVAITLSGDNAETGRNFEAGMNIALQEIEEQGLLKDYELDLKIVDDQNDTTTSLNVVNEMIFNTKVKAIIGQIYSTNTLVTLPICNENGIPMLVPGLNPTFSQNGYDYFFRVCGTNEGGQTAGFEYFIKDLGLTKIGIISETSENGQTSYGIAKNIMGSYGLEFVCDENFTTGDKDFSTQVLKLKESGAQAVYTTAAATDAVVLLEQIRQVIGDDILVLANGASESNFLELAGSELAEGVLYYTVWTPALQDQKSVDFVQKYEAATGRQPADVSARGYDATWIIATALASMDGYDVNAADFSAKLADAIRNVDYTGLQGTFHYDDVGEAFYTMKLITYQDGEHVVVRDN